jgi:hypothetical protein
MAARMAVTRPDPLTGSWTFWADTIVGFTPLGPVACAQFTGQRLLSGFGTGSAVIVSASTALPPERLMRLYSWRLWAFYNGTPVWGGIPTGIADTGAQTVTLTLTELPGYLAKRVIDTAGGLSFSQAEQTAVAAQLAAPLADIGVSVVSEAGAGYARDAAFEYLGSTDRAQLLTTFTQQLDGPEFRAEYSVDPGGRPHCTLRIAYPRVGADTGLGLSMPGNATDYTGTWDTDRMRTRTFVTGAVAANAAAGATAPVVVVDQPQADLPRMDAVDDYQDMSVVSVLTSRANTAAAQYAGPVPSITGAVPVALPALGSYAPGDDVTLMIYDELMPGGLVTTGRLIEMDIDAAAGTVALTTTTVLPPPRARDTLAARLWQGTVSTARMTHRNLAAVAARDTGTPGGAS